MKKWSKAEENSLFELVSDECLETTPTWSNIAGKLNQIYKNNRSKVACRKKWVKEIFKKNL